MIAARSAVLATPPAVHGGRLALDNLDTTGAVAKHDFSVCLNAFGPAPIVTRAIVSSRVDEYPDPHNVLPRQAAAARWDRPVGEIVFAAGAAELIYAACHAYLRAADRVLIVRPAFGEYERAARLCGAHIRAIDVFEVPFPTPAIVNEVAQVRPRLLFLATPMNPSGRALSRADVQRIAQACCAVDCLLVLDQAYDPFTEDPVGTPAVPGHSHVLHVRSLTKDHALAGVRVAFAIAPPEIAGAIERVRVPWSASSAAQAAGAAAMHDEAIAHVARTTTLLRAEANRMMAACSVLGVSVHASVTHFFLIGCESARATTERLLNGAGILVRDCTSFGLPNWIRVAARRPAENNVLLAALQSERRENQP